MGWIIAAAASVFILYLLFIHGASMGRSERYQQELDDEQMRRVSRKKETKE